MRNFFAAKHGFSAMVTWRSVLESVAQILPSMMTLFSDHLRKLAVWESELCKQRAADKIHELREVTTVESVTWEAQSVARGCHRDA